MRPRCPLPLSIVRKAALHGPAARTADTGSALGERQPSDDRRARDLGRTKSARPFFRPVGPRQRRGHMGGVGMNASGPIHTQGQRAGMQCTSLATSVDAGPQVGNQQVRGSGSTHGTPPTPPAPQPHPPASGPQCPPPSPWPTPPDPPGPVDRRNCPALSARGAGRRLTTPRPDHHPLRRRLRAVATAHGRGERTLWLHSPRCIAWAHQMGVARLGTRILFWQRFERDAKKPCTG